MKLVDASARPPIREIVESTSGLTTTPRSRSSIVPATWGMGSAQPAPGRSRVIAATRAAARKAWERRTIRSCIRLLPAATRDTDGVGRLCGGSNRCGGGRGVDLRQSRLAVMGARLRNETRIASPSRPARAALHELSDRAAFHRRDRRSALSAMAGRRPDGGARLGLRARAVLRRLVLVLRLQYPRRSRPPPDRRVSRPVVARG